MTPDTRIRERLKAILELAERPGTDGERDAALQAIGRIVVANKWLASSSGIETAARRPPTWTMMRPSRSWQQAVERCSCHPERLSDWEQDFIRSLLYRRSITTRQAACLHKIAGRLGCDWAYP